MTAANPNSNLDFDAILSRFQAAQTQANQANVQRYQQLLQTLRDLQAQTGETYGEALANIRGLGEAQEQRIGREATRETGRAEQDLISRGLGNTTIRESVRRGIEEDAQLNRQQLAESVALNRNALLQQQVGTDVQLGQLLASAIERRDDVGPNPALYAQLLQSAASSNTRPVQAQVGASGGGGGGVGGGGFAPDPASLFTLGRGGSSAPTGSTQARVVTRTSNSGRTVTNPGGETAEDRIARRAARTTLGRTNTGQSQDDRRRGPLSYLSNIVGGLFD